MYSTCMCVGGSKGQLVQIYYVCNTSRTLTDSELKFFVWYKDLTQEKGREKNSLHK